jgi:hypothetical protein
LPLNFIGRPYGLGNRVEEIIRLEGLSDRIYRPIYYFWRNPRQRLGGIGRLGKAGDVDDRSYPILLRAGNVTVLPFQANLGVDFDPLTDITDAVDCEELRRVAARIQPVFEVAFPEGLNRSGSLQGVPTESIPVQTMSTS